MASDPKIEASRTKPVLLYLVTEDWYFMSHRLPMAIAAQNAGYEVQVATNVDKYGAQIEAHGFRLHPLSWRRGSANPVYLLSAVLQIRALYRRLRPDLIHHVALQSVIIGATAALGLRLAQLNAFGGLGSTYTSQSAKALALRSILKGILRWLLNGPRNAVLVQNLDDRKEIESIGIAAEQIFRIPGSGVDVVALSPLPEPPEPVTVAFVGRLLEDKGIRVLIAAQDLLSARGRQIRVLIAGEPDPANPASIPESEIETWKTKKNVVVAGHVEDIRAIWAAAHIAVLPSRREGLPKSLLEAAACGRPLIATDVPGCREIARKGINALLVPPDNPMALAEAIEQLSDDPPLRAKFGAESRRLVIENFSSDRIGEQTVSLYDRLLSRPHAEGGIKTRVAQS